MDYKDLFIRFILGGGAVMITAVLMVGIASGSKNAAKIANGSVYGMVGGVFCVATVWFVLQFSNNWILSIIVGFLMWLGSSIVVSTLRERVKNIGMRRANHIVNVLSEPRARHNK